MLWKTFGIGVGVLGLSLLNVIEPSRLVATGVRIPVKGSWAAAQGLGWSAQNWSGYALSTSEVNSFYTISGSWQVPTVSATSVASSSFGSNWIGIDGFNNPDLIQTGTSEQMINGVSQYGAWWEILPQFETPIENMVVKPGNIMHASIRNLGNDLWRITIQNLSLHESFTTLQHYTGPAQSAEWIQERPQINGNLSILDPYSTFDFINASVNGINPQLKPSEGGVMVQHGQQVSTPSYPSASQNSFAVAYGSLMPAPPLVMPVHIFNTQPYQALVGQPLQISGFGFGTSAGSVTIGGVAAPVLNWTPNLITVTVPNVATGPEPLEVMAINGLATRTIEVAPSQNVTPTILNALPNPAMPGSVVRLVGRNFGNTQGVVTLDHTAAQIDSWSPSMIMFTVPTSAAAGSAPITLTTAQGNTVTDSNFVVSSGPSPSIRSVFPGAAQAGQMVRISGTNFGTTPGAVTIGGTPAKVQAWSPYFITASVPSVATGTQPLVVTTAGGIRAQDTSFQVIGTPAPLLRSVFPNPAQVGQVVHMLGSNLGNVTGTIIVGTVKARIQSWSPYYVTFVVPNVASGSEPVILTTNTDQSTQLNTFVVATAPAPHISAIYPNPAKPGTPLRIIGSNFGTAPGQVTINGHPVTVQYWSPYSIEVMIPSNLSPGTAVLSVIAASGIQTHINLTVK